MISEGPAHRRDAVEAYDYIVVGAGTAGCVLAARAFAETLTQNGCPVTDDLSGRVQEGVAWPDLAIADGERVSPADGYPRPVLGRPNLDLATGSVATRLNMRHGR